jgi:hypothetical protein
MRRLGRADILGGGMGARGRAEMGRVLALAGLLVAAGGGGCVERRLFIRSDPPGARVTLDGEPRGETPLAIPFTYYGTREVVLRAPGRRVVRREVALTPPWYQWTPLDLVSELLLPVTIEDVHEVEVLLPEMERASDESVEALLARAERAASPRAPSGTAGAGGGAGSGRGGERREGGR